MKYKLSVTGVVDIEEGITSAKIISTIPANSEARSAQLFGTIEVEGTIAFDAETTFLTDNAKALREWSFLKTDSPDIYKPVTVELEHNGAVVDTLELDNAFVISYEEGYKDQNGYFKLVVRQKKARM